MSPAADPLNLSMFRAYDIRTPSERHTPELAERLARAEAVYFTEELGVSAALVAHDARATGPQYLSLGVEAFLAAGLDVVWLPGVTSTSHYYFSAMRRPECAAIMFGASHNPAGDTGQKVLAPGVRPVAERIGPAGGLDRIRALYEAGASVRSDRRGRLYPLDTMGDYLTTSMALAEVEPGSLAGTRILHDYLNGAGGRELLLAFDRAGAELRGLHFAADGRFPLGDPNPVKPDVIREGLAELAAGDYLLACFFDGDADRMDVYGGDGRYLASSFVYAGMLPSITRRHRREGVARPGVFADLKSNPLAVIQMAKAGVSVEVIRNGHSQIKSALFDDPRMIGAVEESAHFYEAFSLDGRGPYCTENTLYDALLLTRVWREEPERFAELFALQDQTRREREWGHHFERDESRAAALDAVKARFEALGATAMEETRGGLDLEATLMRRGLPFDIDATTRLADDWLQVCQRISQSENGLARWEVVAATEEIAADAKAEILRMVAAHGGGEAYRG